MVVTLREDFSPNMLKRHLLSGFPTGETSSDCILEKQDIDNLTDYLEKLLAVRKNLTLVQKGKNTFLVMLMLGIAGMGESAIYAGIKVLFRAWISC